MPVLINTYSHDIHRTEDLRALAWNSATIVSIYVKCVAFDLVAGKLSVSHRDREQKWVTGGLNDMRSNTNVVRSVR
jgi:hypothetical protein